MAESWLEDKACKYAKASGWIVRKVKYIGRDGAPDRWFLKNGRWLIIEFKTFGKEPNPQQEREIKRLVKAGAEAYAIDNFAEFLRVLDA